MGYSATCHVNTAWWTTARPVREEGHKDGGRVRVRRFIFSLGGKIACAVAVWAMLMPTIMLVLLSKPAEAQLVSLPTWAVVQFDVKGGSARALGASASEALVSELGKRQRYDVLSMEQVDRTIQNLGFVQPLMRRNEIVRLGQELRANTVVSGEIVNSRVVAANGGKRADVMMRVIVWDVASGEQVNGAAVLQSSGVRAGDVSDETLLNEALSAAAFESVNAIQRNTLANATILNTTNNRALINQGARTGFTTGQEVIVLRGREQVARGRVASVEPDQALVEVTSQTKGIQPGDKVRAVFQVPVLDPRWPANNQPRTVSARTRGSNSGLVSTLLVLALVGFVVLGSGGNNASNVTSVTAEPTVVPDAPEDRPAVKISWRVDAFIKGNQDRVQFQVWRDDVADTPVLVVPGSQSSAIDRGDNLDTFLWGNYPIAGGFQCNSSEPGQSGNGSGLTAGRPYTYSVELIYRVTASDVPGTSAGTTGGGSTGGGTTGGGTTGGATGGIRGDLDSHYARVARQITTTGGTTGTTTGGTTGTTTGTTTGGTTSGTGDFCYFRTDRRVARGTATPFVRPRLSFPANNQTVAASTIFRFSSVRGGSVDITIQYALQFSTDAQFRSNVSTILVWEDRTGTGTLSTPRAINEVTTFAPSAQRVYWRVGARNLADQPGPVVDGGQRFVFSQPFWFQRPVLPPSP